MTPALRHNDADKKLLLLAIWKLLWWENFRSTKSTQMTAEPSTQAVKQSVKSHTLQTGCTHQRPRQRS
jgi:hypothetical protein